MDKKRTDLQNSCAERLLTRDLYITRMTFAEAQVNFYQLLRQSCIQALQAGETFTMLDIGCGSGACLEECLRNLKIQLEENRDKIRGIGLDQNPLPEMIPNHILSLVKLPHRSILPLSQPQTKEPLPEGVPIAEFIQGDVCKLPFEDDSIDFCYCVGTLIYVGDTLKALGEIYRVLKPGGTCLLEICEKEISIRPRFHQILEETPGSSEVFTYKPSPFAERTGFLVIKKTNEDLFEGFPYSPVRILTKAEDRGYELGNNEDFFQNAFYKRNEQ